MPHRVCYPDTHNAFIVIGNMVVSHLNGAVIMNTMSHTCQVILLAMFNNSGWHRYPMPKPVCFELSYLLAITKDECYTLLSIASLACPAVLLPNDLARNEHRLCSVRPA